MNSVRMTPCDVFVADPGARHVATLRQRVADEERRGEVAAAGSGAGLHAETARVPRN